MPTLLDIAPQDPKLAALQNVVLPYRQLHFDEEMMELFRFQSRMELQAGECKSGIRSSYHPAEHIIVLCLQDADEAFHTFTKLHNSIGASRGYAQGYMEFVFFHELAHAVIDDFVPDLTGALEEESADEFASFLMSQYPATKGALLDAAFYYEYSHELGRSSTIGDSHDPNDRRAAKMMCILYAADPNSYAKELQFFSLTLPDVEHCQDIRPAEISKWAKITTQFATMPVFKPSQ